MEMEMDMEMDMEMEMEIVLAASCGCSMSSPHAISSQHQMSPEGTARLLLVWD